MLLSFAGALASVSCTPPGTHPAAIVHSESTDAFPVNWEGQRTNVPPPLPPPAPAPTSANPPAAALGPAAPPGTRLRIQPRQLVAVLELRTKLKGQDADDVDAAYFGNQVRAQLKLGAPDAQVMTRENVLVMLQAPGKTLADCEGECEVDTGRRLGADLVISGEILRVGTKLKIDLRLHDTHSGQLLQGATVQGKSVDELDADLPRAVRALITQ
ncbi:MAG: hypothetical protein JST92_09015 [Deltaproteobacteria bacterium]|nr:hypothetical protein [Deltaproteobacteria bacterium]